MISFAHDQANFSLDVAPATRVIIWYAAIVRWDELCYIDAQYSGSSVYDHRMIRTGALACDTEAVDFDSLGEC